MVQIGLVYEKGWYREDQSSRKSDTVKISLQGKKERISLRERKPERKGDTERIGRDKGSKESVY